MPRQLAVLGITLLSAGSAFALEAASAAAFDAAFALANAAASAWDMPADPDRPWADPHALRTSIRMSVIEIRILLDIFSPLICDCPVPAIFYIVPCREIYL